MGSRVRLKKVTNRPHLQGLEAGRVRHVQQPRLCQRQRRDQDPRVAGKAPAEDAGPKDGLAAVEAVDFFDGG
jgi:hypothetical protein